MNSFLYNYAVEWDAFVIKNRKKINFHNFFFTICCCQWKFQQYGYWTKSIYALIMMRTFFNNKSTKNCNYPCSKLYWLVLRHKRIALVFDRWHDTWVNPVFRLLCRNCSHPERRTEVKHMYSYKMVFKKLPKAGIKIQS